MTAFQPFTEKSIACLRKLSAGAVDQAVDSGRCAAQIVSKRALTASGSGCRPGMPDALRPRPANWATERIELPPSRPTTATCAPSRANSQAIARPMRRRRPLR